MITLTGYQEKAVKESSERMTRLLEDIDPAISTKRFLLQAPTGAGKTVMAAEIVKALASQENNDFAFIFLAPNSLHIQAKESFSKYLISENVTCITDLPAGGGALVKNSILFLNWASINRKGNDKIKENERGEYIGKVVSETHARERKIIVIIDEAHNTANSKKSQELLTLIHPELIFEITATPTSKPDVDGSGDMWRVPRAKAIEEHMICESAYFNHNIEAYEAKIRNKAGGAVDPNLLYVYSAIQELGKFKKEIIKAGNAYNPLLGIQLPPEASASKDSAKEIKLVDEIIGFLVENGFERDKIAVYLSDRKENMDGITDLHSEIEVVIFKAAIAIGWDCPRLKVGALLRDTKTKPFAVQTLGRWMRQPIQKSFDNPYLNSAYLYTEYQLMPTVANEDMEIIVAQSATVRSEFYEKLSKIKLPAVLPKGKSVSHLPLEFFTKNFSTCLVQAYNKIHSTTPKMKTSEILIEFDITSSAKASGSTEGIRKAMVSDIDFAESVDMGVAERLSTAHEAEVKFINAIKDAIAIEHVDNYAEIAHRVLYVLAKVTRLLNSDIARFCAYNHGFRTIVVTAVKDVVEKYNTQFPGVLNAETTIEEIMWAPAESIEVKATSSGNFVTTPSTSAYAYTLLPSLTGNNGSAWKTEEAYLALSHTDKYKEKFFCVFKNGDSGVLNFGIPYDDDESGRTVKRVFYPDWIGIDKDMNIFIHETKSGSHVFSPNTKAKKEALDKYIKTLTERGVKITGGIVNIIDAGTPSQRFLIANENSTSLNLTGEGTNWQELI